MPTPTALDDPATAPGSVPVDGQADRPPRVALIASVRHGLREPHAGGLERHTADLATQLRRRGHDVVVYASGDSDPDLGVRPICDRATQLDLSPAARRDVSMLSDRFMAEHHAYLSLMLSLAEDPGVDVVHDNSLHHLPVAMSRALRVPLVKVLHTPPTPWLESALAQGRATTTPARPGSTGVTLVSVSEANARSWRTPVDRVIRNGVDVDRFTPGPGGGPLVWSGRLVAEKAPHHALAAAHAADIDLLLVGPASDQRYLDREIRPLLDGRRRWVGHLPRADLAEVLGRAAACLVTPAWDEPYGLVVAEALACGTPVVGYARGALPELVTDEVGVLVPPDDVRALAAAIAPATQLDRVACRARAVEHASLDRMIADYQQLYVELCAPPGTTSGRPARQDPR